VFWLNSPYVILQDRTIQKLVLLDVHKPSVFIFSSDVLKVLKEFETQKENELKSLLFWAFLCFAIVVIISFPITDYVTSLKLSPWYDNLIKFLLPLITSSSIYSGIIFFGLQRYEKYTWKNRLAGLVLEGTWFTEYTFDSNTESSNIREYAIGVARIRQSWDGEAKLTGDLYLGVKPPEHSKIDINNLTMAVWSSLNIEIQPGAKTKVLISFTSGRTAYKNKPSPTTPEAEEVIGIDDLFVHGFKSKRPCIMKGKFKVWQEKQVDVKTGVAKWQLMSINPEYNVNLDPLDIVKHFLSNYSELNSLKEGRLN